MKKISIGYPMEYEDDKGVIRTGLWLKEKEVELLEKTLEKANKSNNIINELEKMVNDFDVFKEFTFPLMKRDEEHQVKSSIDYEWRKSIKEPFLDKLKELKENK